MAHCDPIKDALEIAQTALTLGQEAAESARNTADTLEAVVMQLEGSIQDLEQQLIDCEDEHDDGGMEAIEEEARALWCAVYCEAQGQADNREVVANDAVKRFRKQFGKGGGGNK